MVVRQGRNLWEKAWRRDRRWGGRVCQGSGMFEPGRYRRPGGREAEVGISGDFI
jgi:hypothetical protein